VQHLNPELELWCSSGIASSKHLSSILDNVLDQSKLEAGKLKLEQLPVNLNEVCHAVTNMLRYHSVFLTPTFAHPPQTCSHHRHTKHGNVSLSVSVPRDLTVVGDVVRWRQLLINLLSNALKFTESGSVCLNMRCIQSDVGEDELLVEITDTGHGIPKEDMSKLFHKYSQGGFHAGSGLGLIIAKQIARLMDADIKVDSPWRNPSGSYTQGTRFSFVVPKPMFCLAEATPGDKSQPSPQQQLVRDRLTVLLVEDDALNTMIMKVKVIQAASALFSTVHIEACIHGEAALQKYDELQNSSVKVDLILMDEHLEISGGVLTGSQTTKLLRDLGCECTIIACTGNCMPSDRAHYKAAGADHVWPKPYPAIEVMAQDLQDLVQPAADGLAESLPGVQPEGRIVAIAEVSISSS
jgi:CheY-like chemotaxis protein